MTTISTCARGKRMVAGAARVSGVTAAARALERRNPSLRILNLHSVPKRYVAAIDRLFAHLARTYRFASPSELPGLLDGVEQPTILVCFDDGLESTVTCGASAVERVGGRVVLAVPAAWPDVSEEEQETWFARHVYPAPTELHDRPGDVRAASWSSLREAIARGHEVWSHGFDHLRLDRTLPPETLDREVRVSRLRLEERLDSAVRGYCPPRSYNLTPEARDAVRATYTLAFSGGVGAARAGVDPHTIPRTNIEATWAPFVVDFLLTRIGDVAARAAA